MKYAIAASILVLAIAVLICALMPRYYLVFAFPEKTVIQMGPFTTQSSCERAQHRIAEVFLGTSDPADEKDIKDLSTLMVCVSSR